MTERKITPLRSIRKKCIDCCNGQSHEVTLCTSENCPLWSFRLGKGGGRYLKIIRKKCIDCGEGTAFDVKNCDFSDCPLHQYRFGKNPALKGKRTCNLKRR